MAIGQNPPHAKQDSKAAIDKPNSNHGDNDRRENRHVLMIGILRHHLIIHHMIIHMSAHISFIHEPLPHEAFPHEAFHSRQIGQCRHNRCCKNIDNFAQPRQKSYKLMNCDYFRLL